MPEKKSTLFRDLFESFGFTIDNMVSDNTCGFIAYNNYFCITCSENNHDDTAAFVIYYREDMEAIIREFSRYVKFRPANQDIGHWAYHCIANDLHRKKFFNREFGHDADYEELRNILLLIAMI